MADKILALIPARGGSKGVPGKNIKILSGYPLIAYAICAAKMVRQINTVVVSTDSQEIASIAKEYGAQVPFIRPARIAQDNSTDLDVFKHAIKYFEDNSYCPDLIIHLRPTTPLRDPQGIARAIKLINSRENATSLRSVHELAEPPHKMFGLDLKGYLKGFFPHDRRPEYYNLPRQMFPKAYHSNGYVDIIKPELVKKKGVLHGNRILGFVSPVSVEVDRPEDFEYLEYLLKKRGSPILDYLIKNFPRKG